MPHPRGAPGGQHVAVDVPRLSDALTVRLRGPFPTSSPGGAARGVAREISFCLYYSRDHLNTFGSERLPRSADSQVSGSARREAPASPVWPPRWTRTPSPAPGTAGGPPRDPGLGEAGRCSAYGPRPGVCPLPRQGGGGLGDLGLTPVLSGLSRPLHTRSRTASDADPRAQRGANEFVNHEGDREGPGRGGLWTESHRVTPGGGGGGGRGRAAGLSGPVPDTVHPGTRLTLTGTREVTQSAEPRRGPPPRPGRGGDTASDAERTRGNRDA